MPYPEPGSARTRRIACRRTLVTSVGWSVAILCALGLACSGGKSRLYPRPAPMAAHASGELSASQQKRLGDIRRFLAPADQAQLERTMNQLAEDPNLDPKIGERALQRALSGFSGADGFCEELRRELVAHRYTGPRALAPERVAFAVPIREAHERWLSDAGRDRYADPLALARALRDKTHGEGDFTPGASLGAPGEPLFVIDAREFAERGPSAATRLCLTGPASPSYAVAFLEVASLPSELRVPTAADGACRPRFELPEPDARHGRTCSGRPEYVTEPATVGAATEIVLSR